MWLVMDYAYTDLRYIGLLLGVNDGQCGLIFYTWTVS